MSKIYNNYLKLKENDEETFFLFKSGIFYIFIAEDAKKMSEVLGLKLTLLNNTIVKCGFPSVALNKYVKILIDKNISFKIIDAIFPSINSIEEYLKKANIIQIIKTIDELDINNVSPIDALNILTNLQKKLHE